MTDSLKTAADTLNAAGQPAYGFTNLINNHGGTIALSGILIVFLGLILIALTISLFNFFSSRVQKREQKEKLRQEEEAKTPAFRGDEIPTDHLIAITAAVELYRRLHLDPIRTKVTFDRGEIHTPWKTGYKFGQRIAPRK